MLRAKLVFFGNCFYSQMLTTRRHLVVRFFFSPTKFQKQSEFRFHVTDRGTMEQGDWLLTEHPGLSARSSPALHSECVPSLPLCWQTSVLGHFIYIHVTLLDRGEGESLDPGGYTKGAFLFKQTWVQEGWVRKVCGRKFRLAGV